MSQVSVGERGFGCSGVEHAANGLSRVEYYSARPDALEKIRGSTKRLTWIDSLVFAALVLANSEAGMSAESIASDLGRSVATIGRHLAGKTEAGRLVRETYERLAGKGSPLSCPCLFGRRRRTLRSLRPNSLGPASWLKSWSRLSAAKAIRYPES